MVPALARAAIAAGADGLLVRNAPESMRGLVRCGSGVESAGIPRPHGLTERNSGSYRTKFVVQVVSDKSRFLL